MAGAFSLLPATASAQGRAEGRNSSGLRKALLANGPDPAYERELMTYGQFVGSWDLVSTQHSTGKVITGEAHFGWVMRGRAVQDIWISNDPDDPGFGTTVRIYRPDEQAWWISFQESVGIIAAQLTGKVVGDEIVENSNWDAGDFPTQWVFSNIRSDGFHWRVQSPDGTVYLSSVATRVC